MRIFLLLIGTLAIVFGVKFVYDARPIVKKYFALEDKNETSYSLKIIGFILMGIGSLIIFYMF
jgi:hypothetical protein